MQRKENRRPLPRRPGWRDIRDEFWEEIKGCIPKAKPGKGPSGRQPAEPRKIPNGIFYVLHTGCQWKMLHREYYSGILLGQHDASIFPALGRPRSIQKDVGALSVRILRTEGDCTAMVDSGQLYGVNS